MYSAILRPEHHCKQIRDGYNTAEYLVGAYCKQNLLLIFASRSQVYKSCRIYTDFGVGATLPDLQCSYATENPMAYVAL